MIANKTASGGSGPQYLEVGGTVARAYNGGLGQRPQRGPGTEPLVRGPGGKAPLPVKLIKALSALGTSMEAANLAIFFSKIQKRKCIRYLCYDGWLWNWGPGAKLEGTALGLKPPLKTAVHQFALLADRRGFHHNGNQLKRVTIKVSVRSGLMPSFSSFAILTLLQYGTCSLTIGSGPLSPRSVVRKACHLRR